MIDEILVSHTSLLYIVPDLPCDMIVGRGSLHILGIFSRRGALCSTDRLDPSMNSVSVNLNIISFKKQDKGM